MRDRLERIGWLVVDIRGSISQSFRPALRNNQGRRAAHQDRIAGLPPQPRSVSPASTAPMFPQHFDDVNAHVLSRARDNTDVKPSNIMIPARGAVKVMDFGLVKLIPQSEFVQSKAETEALISTPGAIIGALPYRSPEQL